MTGAITPKLPSQPQPPESHTKTRRCCAFGLVSGRSQGLRRSAVFWDSLRRWRLGVASRVARLVAAYTTSSCLRVNPISATPDHPEQREKQRGRTTDLRDLTPQKNNFPTHPASAYPAPIPVAGQRSGWTFLRRAPSGVWAWEMIGAGVPVVSRAFAQARSPR